MDKIIINGGNKLNGSITMASAKNAYLPILAGTILAGDEVVLHKCPYYLDIFSMCEILEGLGISVLRQDDTLVINSKNITGYEILGTLARKVRSSIFALGAILGRQKKAKVAYPGGCEIGTRPIDLHIKGLEALNVKIVDKHGYLWCDGSNMRGGTVNLDFPSVGATENIIMAAVLTKGTTKIINAAKEPEVRDLQDFLNSMGAKVYGGGTDTIIIDGVKKLHGGEFTPISDRIIAGTYLIACAMAGGKVEIKNANPFHNEVLLDFLSKCACKIEASGDKIKISSDGRLKSIKKIETMPYPGFPTDLQPQFMAMSAIADGTTMIVENLFETRFKHIPSLIQMGADITVKDRSAVIRGVKGLYGAEVSSTDLRGGAALVLAGLVANGYTTVSNVEHIDRGYDNLENDLYKLGGDIKRIYS